MEKYFGYRKAPSFLVNMKKWGYLTSLIPAFVIYALSYMSSIFNSNIAAILFGFLILFGLIPLLDYVIGRDTSNPTDAEQPILDQDHYYRYLTYLIVPIQLSVIFFGGEFLVSNDLSFFLQIALAVLVGVVTATLGITTGHELVHKTSRLEQNLGGILYSTVCYGGFKVEHVRGHHVNVGTSKDHSSAEYNQTLFQFIPIAMFHNVTAAFKLEANRLKVKGLSFWHYRNELLYWYGLSLLWLGLSFYLWGMGGAVYFLMQSFAAAIVLEAINYVEHYGLRRKQKENGQYEKVMPYHSWNNDHFFSNLILFQLQRHSDHHYRAAKRYQVLVNHSELPQLPLGYPIMLLMAFFPPLWFRVMNPRVKMMEQYVRTLS